MKKTLQFGSCCEIFSITKFQQKQGLETRLSTPEYKRGNNFLLNFGLGFPVAATSSKRNRRSKVLRSEV